MIHINDLRLFKLNYYLIFLVNYFLTLFFEFNHFFIIRFFYQSLLLLFLKSYFSLFCSYNLHLWKNFSNIPMFYLSSIKPYFILSSFTIRLYLYIIFLYFWASLHNFYFYQKIPLINYFETCFGFWMIVWFGNILDWNLSFIQLTFSTNQLFHLKISSSTQIPSNLI